MQRGVAATDLVMHQSYLELQKPISGHMCLTCVNSDPQPSVINIGKARTGALLYCISGMQEKLSIMPELHVTIPEMNANLNNIFQLRDVIIVFECVWAVNLLIIDVVRLIRSADSLLMAQSLGLKCFDDKGNSNKQIQTKFLLWEVLDDEPSEAH